MVLSSSNLSSLFMTLLKSRLILGHSPQQWVNLNFDATESVAVSLTVQLIMEQGHNSQSRVIW